LFASFEGKGEGFWNKRKEQVERIEDFEIHFFFVIRNPPILEELKNCIGGF
jgi:hypothetical protein